MSCLAAQPPSTRNLPLPAASNGCSWHAEDSPALLHLARCRRGSLPGGAGADGSGHCAHAGAAGLLQVPRWGLWGGGRGVTQASRAARPLLVWNQCHGPSALLSRLAAHPAPPCPAPAPAHLPCRGLGDTRTPFYATVLANLLNVALEPLFIFALGWGVRGAALAVGISQVCKRGMRMRVCACVRACVYVSVRGAQQGRQQQQGGAASALPATLASVARPGSSPAAGRRLRRAAGDAAAALPAAPGGRRVPLAHPWLPAVHRPALPAHAGRHGGAPA